MALQERREPGGLGPGPDVARRALEQVERDRDEQLAWLRRLLAFRTESQDPEASHFLPEVDACRDFLAETLREDGFELQSWEARGVTFERHPVLAGRLAGRGGGRSIALNGHFDVVPAGDPAAWSRDPWGGGC